MKKYYGTLNSDYLDKLPICLFYVHCMLINHKGNENIANNLVNYYKTKNLNFPAFGPDDSQVQLISPPK